MSNEARRRSQGRFERGMKRLRSRARGGRGERERTESTAPGGAPQGQKRTGQRTATVPEIAAACDLPSAQVLWHIAAMRKYGQLAEDVQDGDYFNYRLLLRQERRGDR